MSLKSNNVRYYLQTLDLDHADKDSVEKILHKVMGKTCCQGCTVKPSSHSGYHVMIFCSRKCDECRLVFDDTERFRRDLRRPDRRRNVLFHVYKYYVGKGKDARSLRPAAVKPAASIPLIRWPPEQGG